MSVAPINAGDALLGTSSSPKSVAVARGGVLASSWRMGRTRLGVVIVGLLVLVAFVGPLIAPHSTTDFVAPPFSGTSGTAILGTDFMGRDVLSRFLYGGHSVLILSILAATLAIVTGVTIGLASAYLRGWVDSLLMRLMDLVLVFPQVVLALVMVATVGPKLWILVLTVGLTGTPRVARVIRGAALVVVEQDFVLAAEALGESRRGVLWRQILPNVLGPLMVESSMRFTYSIGVVASLSFLGFGLQPPAADWGVMIQENRTGLGSQPLGVLAPIAAIALLTIGLSLIGDGVARAAAGVDREVRRA